MRSSGSGFRTRPYFEEKPIALVILLYLLLLIHQMGELSDHAVRRMRRHGIRN
jgi:hypothetical protein